MKIHHIINSFGLADGGAERLVRRLHICLRSKYFDSKLLGLLGLPDGDALPFAKSMKLSSPYGWKAFKAIWQYVVNEVADGDIVHAHLFPTIFYLSVLKKIGILRAKLIYTEHSTSNRRRGKWYGRLIDRVAYAGCDCVVAISQGTYDEVVGWKPALASKTIVVQNGVYLPFDTSIEREPKMRPVVASVGRICKAKNYQVILEAIALLDDIDFEYQVAGDGPDLEELEKLCSMLGVNEKVVFLGYVPEVSSLLSRSDLFLIASRWEGFGLAAVEAMNASLPVIASDIPGLREVVTRDPACAILVDPDSPESIADGLRNLLIHGGRRVEMGRAAFTHSKVFDENRMVESYMTIYDELIGCKI